MHAATGITMTKQAAIQTGLRPSIAGDIATAHAEIDKFEVSLRRFLDGRISEANFLEYRLRQGVYGQRQDNVHMMRSKLPLGLLAPDQLEAFADLTEAYASGVAHLTTRQDIQVHFVPLDKTPDLMRVLADAEMTSREACGNVVRNICAAETAGILLNEPFDVTPYGMALAKFLLRHPDGQSLGRKFKITMAGNFDPAYNLGPIHDIGATAVERDGQRGFHVVVGGGLGAVPHQAQLLSDFLPTEELLPTSLAMLRVFGKHGEKKKRAKARLKFLVAKWGIERFRQEVAAERRRLEDEGQDLGTTLLAEQLDGRWDDSPAFAAGPEFPEAWEETTATWLRTNVLRQRQTGYAAVRVRVPRGDLEPWQLRGLAELLRNHSGDTMRIAPDQSLLIRFVPFDRLLSLRDGLEALKLAGPRAGGLGDTVTCPGADSCKLGVTSPRSVARHIEPLLDRLAANPRLEGLRVKISGCPNSCAQQQTADIGLFGAARTIEGHAAPHYIMFVGGRPGGHVGLDGEPGYGTNVARIPALRVGEAIERLTERYLEDSDASETWSAWTHRVGRKSLQSTVADFLALPGPADASQFYREIGRAEPFRVVRGVGECAGEVVLASDLLLLDADRAVEATVAAFDERQEPERVRALALEAMFLAARALLSTQDQNPEADERVVQRFAELFYEPGLIYEGTGAYFLTAVAEPIDAAVGDRLRRLVVESGLFVEEVHAMVSRMNRGPAPSPTVQLNTKARIAP